MNYRTFYTTRISGRLFGARSSTARLFFSEVADNGDPILIVRHHGKGPNTLELYQGETLLAQLLAFPEIPWLGQAVTLDEKPRLMFIPLQPLASLDGEVTPPLPPIVADSMAWYREQDGAEQLIETWSRLAKI